MSFSLTPVIPHCPVTWHSYYSPINLRTHSLQRTRTAQPVHTRAVTEQQPQRQNPRPSGQRTAYDVLCVHEDASAAQIKTAYRRLAAKLHPDVAGASKRAQASFQVSDVLWCVLAVGERRRGETPPPSLRTCPMYLGSALRIFSSTLLLPSAACAAGLCCPQQPHRAAGLRRARCPSAERRQV